LQRRAGWTLAAVALAAAAYSLWPDRRPNVLWISVDSLRADRLPLYGYGANATPVIDYLARHGVVFDAAFSDAPWTTAAMASSMTGRFAAHHGLRTPFTRLRQEETTVAELLAARGYDTAAIAGTYSLDPAFGLDQGFSRYDARYDSPIEDAGKRPHLPSAWYEDLDAQRTYRSQKLRHDSYRGDAAVADAAVAWLRRASRMRPFFLWVHFFGAHRRRVAGETLFEAQGRSLEAYDAAVPAVDAQIGRLLTELSDSGRLSRTLIVLQADHGEGLMQHGELEHGASLYDSVLRIPLILSWPGRFAGVRVAGMVRNVDIAPTVLHLIGLPAPRKLDGRSILPLVDGETLEAQPLLAETLLSAEATLVSFKRDGSLRVPGVRRRGLRTPRWKYVLSEPHPLINFSRQPPQPADAERFFGEELYDLAADPGETTNVLASQPQVAAELRRDVKAQLRDDPQS
jgi:arylsulfatase A-like enzyme